MQARLLCTASLLAALPAAALAQEAGEAGEGDFRLGAIIVTGAPARDGLAIGSESVGQTALEAFGRVRLDEAANLIPGVAMANSGGSRNERLIFVRGFDRFQVPLSIDGIRVYLPADNRLDFGRFLTADVAQIQVAKGYASALDGPGAMGGAINLVTRKPTKALDIEARSQIDLDRDADYAGYTVFGLVGTKQDKWYAQASYARNFTDHWTLPGSFTPARNEDGGERDFSRTQDSRLNLKAGFTPNATDEYSISYTRQDGSKNAPLHVSDSANVSLRNWSWPNWDIESVYFLSTTTLGDRATLKTRLFYSNYDNMLRSWDNRSQNSQLLGRSFDSPYADNAYGGSVELGVALTASNRLSVAFHHRRDEHTETQTSAPGNPANLPEPVQTSLERNWSLAAEDRHTLSPQLAFTFGLSYDWRDLDRAEEYGVPTGASGSARLYQFPLRDADAVNAQGRLDWTNDAGSALYAFVSSRARFPTLFERFSSQFGTAEPNPDLRPERSLNYEVGGSHSFGPVRLAGALFISSLTDALVSVRLANIRNQRVNIGSADYSGGEVSIDFDLGSTLQIGGNYSYIHRSFDVGTAPAGGFIRLFQLTDVPNHKAFAYAAWKPVPGLEILPSVEIASSRVTVTPATANGGVPNYYRTGDYIRADLRLSYAVTDNIELSAGARNLFDEYYVLTDGFPEPGRSYFLSARARY
jgi:iron complex outermembrane receptor protein